MITYGAGRNNGHESCWFVRQGEFVVAGNSMGMFGVNFRAIYPNFNRVCGFAEDVLRRPLNFTEAVNVQAMLGSNSIRELSLGPGGNMGYTPEPRAEERQ